MADDIETETKQMGMGETIAWRFTLGIFVVLFAIMAVSLIWFFIGLLATAWWVVPAIIGGAGICYLVGWLVDKRM